LVLSGHYPGRVCVLWASGAGQRQEEPRRCMLDLLVYWVVPFVLTLGAALVVNYAVQFVLHEPRTKQREGPRGAHRVKRAFKMDTPSSTPSTEFTPVEEVATSAATNSARTYAHGFTLEVGSCAIQGRRPYMEDRRTIIEDLRDLMSQVGKEHSNATERCSFFAVFDGHGGQLASTFASGYLHKNLVKSVHFPQDPIRALEEACELTDREFAEKYQTATSQDGTTACMVLIMGQRLFVANVGDSRAVLCRKGMATPLHHDRPSGRCCRAAIDPITISSHSCSFCSHATLGKAVALSDDHKPDKPSEKKRIEDSGGVVKKGSFFNIPMGPFRYVGRSVGAALQIFFFLPIRRF
jgi:serine/threonine protein phosphatase PrpC